MRRNLRMLCCLTAALFGLWLTGCRGRQEGGSILPEGVTLCEGDIVFRRGGGLESHAVMMMDVDGNYSHVGIVVDTLGRLMVCHAVPGEPDFEGDPDRVKLDDVQTFFSSVYASCGEVMRLRGDSLSPRQAARKALEVYRRGVLFDHAYDSEDTTKMYCTELVMYAYERNGIQLVQPEVPHEVEIPLLTASVFYPSDIAKSRLLSSITQF